MDAQKTSFLNYKLSSFTDKSRTFCNFQSKKTLIITLIRKVNLILDGALSENPGTEMVAKVLA